MRLKIDADRIERELAELAAFSDTPAPAITRVAFSPVDLAARAWLKGKCTDAGLAIREDAVGNLFARWSGREPAAAAVGTGSHIDAIPNSGRFDGTVGVLGGLEAVRALRQWGFEPRRSIELLMFTSEEPTRFGLGCLGSRLLAGTLNPGWAGKRKDAGGCDLNTVLTAAGFSGDLQSVPLAANHYAGFVELHIEQGPLLEGQGTAIGIVTAIAAPAALRIEIEGVGGHAGTVLMRDRADAFLGAAELALQIEAVALQTGSPDSVATTGVCRLFPGAVNSVPSSVVIEVDVRDVERARRDAMVAAIRDQCERTAARRKLQVKVETINADDPARCSDTVIASIENACRQSGLDSLRMVSRAYHDSLFMSRIAPTGMIFVPCRQGISHRPEEFASTADIANGVTVLAETLAELCV